MIHIKLGPTRPAAEDDTMHRDYVGWSPELSPIKLFERNRGRWKFGARARQERYAVFSSTTTGTIVLVAEIDDFEDVGAGKSAIVGTVLEPGDPVYDGLIGQPSLDQYRNPVTYIDDHTLDRPRTCGCGCGGVVAGARQFLPGHDQRAIHDRILSSGVTPWASSGDSTTPTASPLSSRRINLPTVRSPCRWGDRTRRAASTTRRA